MTTDNEMGTSKAALMGAAQRRALPPLYSQEAQGLEAQVRVKFFLPGSKWRWYPTEFDGEDIFFGLVDGTYRELGYFSLSELEAVRGPLGLGVERDRHFEPTSLRELMEQSR